MKNLSSFMGKLAMMLLGLCIFAACSDDDGPSYSTATVQNSELKAILTQKGYTFNEQGNILLDDLANNTTELDLSGTKISQSALSELTILPKLTDVNLSNNNYGPVFHVDSLPSQITGLDLRGNEIYDFEGLVNASVVNDEVVATVLHPFTKLYLPTSCKYNVEDLMPFYTQNQADGKTVDMKMVDDNGSLSAYNTLREIPDQYFRAYLKERFESVFVNDMQIDISKPMKSAEQGLPIHLWYANQFADIDKIESIEGVEYFINNPFLTDFYVSIGYNTHFNLGYIMPRHNVKALQFTNVSTKDGFDFTKATQLANVTLDNDEYLEELDLSNTLVANQELESIDATVDNLLECINCPNLSKITLPQNNVGIINTIFLSNLPKLKDVNLRDIKAVTSMFLFKLPNCDITYPELEYVYNSGGGTLEDITTTRRKITFVISEDVFNKDNTKSFINKYKNNLRDRYSMYEEYDSFSWSKNI